MTTTIEYEDEQVNVIVIFNLPLKDYFYMIAMELARPGRKYVALSATNPYIVSMDRLIRLWERYGVEPIEETRGRRKLINPKRNTPIDVNFVILQRSEILDTL